MTTGRSPLQGLIEKLPTFTQKVYASVNDISGRYIQTVELDAVLKLLAALPVSPPVSETLQEPEEQDDTRVETLKAGADRQELPRPSTLPSPSPAPDNSPLHSFDAVVWAREFCDIAEKNSGTRPDEGWMISWFANALMRGWDEYRWRIEPRLRELVGLALVANNTTPTMTRGLDGVARIAQALERGFFSDADVIFEELLGPARATVLAAHYSAVDPVAGSHPNGPRATNSLPPVSERDEPKAQK